MVESKETRIEQATRRFQVKIQGREGSVQGKQDQDVDSFETERRETSTPKALVGASRKRKDEKSKSTSLQLTKKGWKNVLDSITFLVVT